MDYNAGQDQISLRLKETEKERKEREASGRNAPTSDDAKMFLLQMVINSKQSTSSRPKESTAEASDSSPGSQNAPDVLYIESIMFLLQTLVIKVQFSHFLKLTNFAQHLGKILNKSVHQVHYIFQSSEPLLSPEVLQDATGFQSPSKMSSIQQEDADKFFQEGISLISHHSPTSFRTNQEPDMPDLQRQLSAVDLYMSKNPSNRFVSQSYKKKAQMKAGKSTEQASFLKQRSFKVKPPEHTDDYSTRKKDRLKTFLKQDVQVSLNRNAGAMAERIEAVMMVKQETNWMCSNERIISKHAHRLFIKEYQSSPTELIVSAVNERLNKDESKGKSKTLSAKQEAEKRLEAIFGEQALDGDPMDEVSLEDGAVKMLGALGEVVARKILYFSTFEDMTFQMNGLNVSNLFGEGNEVKDQLVNFHKETFKYSMLQLFGSSNLIGNPARFVNNIGTGVQDFFVKPYQGIKEGGIVNLKEGLVDGSLSLI